MNIEIRNDQIQNAINSSIALAVESALKGYSVTQAIGATLSREAVDGVISEALKTAVSQMNSEELAKVLAAEMQRAITGSVIRLLRESVVGMVVKLRGASEYGGEGARARELIYNELFNPPRRAPDARHGTNQPTN